jgi:hypothetical protein
VLTITQTERKASWRNEFLKWGNHMNERHPRFRIFTLPQHHLGKDCVPMRRVQLPKLSDVTPGSPFVLSRKWQRMLTG